jgi:hypothetical protein
MEAFVSTFVEQLFSAYSRKLENQSRVLDFSASFRKSRGRKKPRKAEGGLTPIEDLLDVDPNSEFDPLTSGVRPREELALVYEIPENLETSETEIKQRKCLDLKRWYCLSRPQYRKSCGMSSLVSCWNFLFSRLGYGALSPLSQEKALTIVGLEPPYTDMRFGSFTGNKTLILWFKALCLHHEVKGNARFLWKLHGKSRTIGIDSDQAFELLANGLQNTSQAFVYHCQNHYFCPVGYEVAPLQPADAYKSLAKINASETERWVVIAEPSKAYASLVMKRWEEVAKDIGSQNPEFLNIRKLERGVQRREGAEFTSGKKLGGNLHCLLVFERLD